jgi:AcrR family transcriptional regulator
MHDNGGPEDRDPAGRRRADETGPTWADARQRGPQRPAQSRPPGPSRGWPGRRGDARSAPGWGGAGAPQRGWHGWDGDPDELWPPFGGPVSRVPGQVTPGERRAEQLAAKMQDQRRGHDRSRARLTRAEIVDAAIAIADAEGADALSMRRIAQVLRAGTMSLYWHISSKELLLDLMRDMLMAEVVVPPPSGDWRADLRTMALSMREMLRRHSWLMEFTGGRPPLGPTTMLWMESALAILDGLKQEPQTRLSILESVNTYVTGTVLRESQEARAHEVEREIEAHHHGDMTQMMTAWRDKLKETGMFPRFIQFLEAGIDPDAPETADARFEFGLDCMLDGIAQRYGRQADQ